MIIHPFDVVEAIPGVGLTGILEPHEVERSITVEAERLVESSNLCQVEDCRTVATTLVMAHRAHSRRPTDGLLLCFEHLERHRTGEQLRIVVEFRR